MPLAMTRPARLCRFVASLAAFILLLAARPAVGQDLNLSINANKSPARPGSSVTYTVHVSNSGTSDVTGATVDIVLPGSTNQFNDSETSDPAGVFCSFGCDGGETLNWTVGDLARGESRVLVYRTILSSSASNMTITTSATLSASEIPDIPASAGVEIDDGSSVVLDIGTEVSPVAAGETFDLRINYGALQGRGGAGFGEIRVTLPSEVQFVEASGTGAESGGVVSWTLGPISGGFNGTEVITVQANSGLSTGTLLNFEAELDPGNTGESPAKILCTIPVHPEEPLHVTLSASGVPTVRDTRTDFTLTVSNTSSSTIQNVNIRLLLPDFITQFGTGSTNDPANVLCDFGCDDGEFLTWTPGDLNPGETRTLFFETGVRDEAFGGALQRFVGLVTTSGFAEKTVAYQYGFTTGPVLTAGLDTDKAPVAVGETYTYRITTGVLSFSSGADDATLRFELPEEVSFVSATGSPNVAGDVLTWAFGPLGAGFSSEQTVTVEAEDTLSDGELLRARVTFDSGTFGESATRGSLITPIAPSSPLKVAFTSNDTPIFPGTRVDFALTVSNDSQFPVSDTEVQLVLGGFLDQFRGSNTSDPANVFCSFGCDSGEILTWRAGTLNEGEAKTLYFQTGTSGSGGDLSRFRGLVNASRGLEQIFTPNIVIDATPVMAFGLSGAPRPIASTDTYTYQLNYGAYAGSGGASDATMRLLLPDGATPVSTNGGTVSGNTVEWVLGAVGAGDGGVRVVEVNVDDMLPEGALLLARASLASGNIGETTQRASFPLTTLNDNPLRLTVTPPQSPVQPDQQVTYNLEIENAGTANIASPNVKILLPDFIDSFDDQPTLPNTDCPDSACEAGEILVWTPPDLTPGQSRTLSFTTNVFSSSNLLGDMLRMRLEASGAGASTIYQTVNTSIANGFTIPVEMATFTASASGETVTLDWATASETNNAGFDIERSTDGATFEKIGFRAGAGTTAEAQSYRFVDRDMPFVGELFYRLRQVDVDGTDEYSEPLRVQIRAEELTFLPSAPNPFETATRLRYVLPTTESVRLDVYDLLGRRVSTLVDQQQTSGPHEVMLDGSRLAPGVYFVRLAAGDRRTTQKVHLVR